ncbi:hypothetical protein NEPAR06_2298 [Nematocida parisii]|uniref:uncharacterized protein n=1 Tax=Nematocida parisii (strain ERTm1 / ATCC PRA-289) TaxID=881290 RepID=UPI000264BA35|nr:uncharacterized protein NEPG_01401 [Nematocida parisii ERTm1]KAI5144884.1 hypothetical protein NEPAR04_2249 [Nematocida parisii]EIJ93829.1 hypothetical protein NEPG_01401 [Nematocida parisii ERTm1]KAI5146330.1 hypothetical protein NEPAR07_2298 [Nematocida parisii]KAI5156816.1 hypothetical protein NEPAR06_2298 [Nematocida parisii]KAI5159034.1 hypothetical protein NEPAR05_2374 [Nematocida parisii]|eukprot:XP_013059229.1 hypothetical protein NEPG_01401 [Nematocida parisii ERTm1]
MKELIKELAYRILTEELASELKPSGKIKKRKQGMIKILCKLCNTQVNSVVFTKHLERCNKQQVPTKKEKIKA